jgi:hypothetical protein
MAKDAVATMGTLLPDGAGGRDAVHVAVFSAVSDENLEPGMHVSIVSQGEIDTKVSQYEYGAGMIGIVDPFIKDAVPASRRFWVYLYPRTITALSHKWSHPAFEQAESSYAPPSQKLISEKWLRDYCINHNVPSYKKFMKAVKDQVLEGYNFPHNTNSLHIDGQDASGDIPAELWVHVENVLGEKLPDEKPTYFSCSC